MSFLKTSLEPLQFYLTLFAFITAFLAIFLFIRKKYTLSIAVLAVAALLVRIMIASIDPFIHLWDEEFHALVAKNMMNNPFKPILIADPVVPYDFKNWTENHLWLHKQPLFLWQIAASMKVFGVNEVAVRLPSAIMSAMATIFIYRMGKLSVNATVGFMSAFLFTFSFMQLEVISGNVFTDHNDVAFMFYETAAIWAFFEYLHAEKKTKWIILIGVFAGCAVLVKWLTGLLVFSAWGILILSDAATRFNWRSYLPIVKAFAVALLVFLPWQLYILLNFPVESRYEFAFSSEHLFTPIEGHAGNNWYHFDQIAFLYGKFATYIILPAFFLFMFKAKKPYKWILPLYLIITYLFFMIAATKMPLFTLVVAPLVFILFGHLLYMIWEYLLQHRQQLKPVVLAVSLMVIGYSTISLKNIEERHTTKSINYRNDRIATLEMIRKATSNLPEGKHVFFNCQGFNHVMLMFYFGHTAYSRMLSEHEIAEAKRNGYKLHVFNSPDIPEYVLKDSDIIKLEYTLVNFP